MCFPLDVGGSGRLQKLKSINNKCFVYYHQQDDKGELCLRVSSLRTRMTLGPSSPRMRKRKEKRAWRVV